MLSIGVFDMSSTPPHPALDFLSGRSLAAIHVHEELRVCREERHLSLDVPAVCVVCMRIDKFTDSKAIGCFL